MHRHEFLCQCICIAWGMPQSRLSCRTLTVPSGQQTTSTLKTEGSVCPSRGGGDLPGRPQPGAGKMEWAVWCRQSTNQRGIPRHCSRERRPPLGRAGRQRQGRVQESDMPRPHGWLCLPAGCTEREH